MKRPVRIALELSAFAAAVALGAWVRIANFPLVLLRGEVLPQLDSDSSYHLRRALLTLRDFPRVPHLDPLMNWPRGAFSPWADGFDLGAATLALVTGGRHDAERAAVAIALWPVLLGVLLLWAILRLARTAAPGRRWRGGALAAVVVAAVMPTLARNAGFGRMDHHVVEMLVMVLLATWALRRFPAVPAAGAPPALAFELEGALVTAVGVYGFTGTPLYLAVVLPPLAWSAWREGRVLGSGAAGLGLGALAAAALTAPAVLAHRMWLAFEYPSLLQPLLVGLAGSGLAVVAWAGGADPARPRRRWGRLALGGAAVVPVLLLGASPVAREVRSGVTGWLFHGDPWLAGVFEFQPYFSSLRGVDPWWTRIHLEHGWAGFALPPAVLLLALLARTRRVRWLLYVTLVLLALTLVQYRFARVLAPFLAVAIGLAVALALRHLGRLLARPTAPAWAPLLLLVLLALDRPTRAVVPPRPPRPIDPAIEAALDLEDRPLAPGAARGVLSIWDWGHHFEALAEAPAVVNGFGSYLDAPEFWAAIRVFEGSQDELDAYLAAHRIGAVVAGAATLGNEVKGIQGELGFKQGILNEGYMKRVPLSPVLIAGSAIPGWGVPHLRHLMPRFASRARVAGLRFTLPYAWTYEVVAGARVRGRAPPGARVIGLLPFFEHRRPHTYKAFTVAGADGTWELVLPFPSGYLTPNLRAPGSWTFAVEGRAPVAIHVPERAVRAGDVVEVGPLPEAAVSAAPRGGGAGAGKAEPAPEADE